MYEFTMGGWWFRWRELDKSSRRLAGWSIACGLLAALPLGIAIGRYSYTIGRCLGAGDWSHCVDASPSLSPPLALLGIGLAVVSALLWAKFSARQDEMFNRVQNWALGMAGAWTGAATGAWALLELGGLVPALSLGVGAIPFLALTAAFWFVAVRRWAY